MPGPPTSSAAAERRHLTLLFCDLVDYSGMANRLDPEDLHALLDTYRSCCEEQCAAFGGTASSSAGDGLLFVFGHPEAHEDDPEQAVHAGLALVDAVPRLRGPWMATIPRGLSIRVGIATGLCVVDAVSSVVGESVNLAARLQAAAAQNSVVIADTTNRLVSALFHRQGLGDLHLKGFSRPVPAWRVLGKREVATRFEGTRGDSRTPFIGRDNELRQLLDLWAAAGEGRGSVARIRGEAGVGKSRLIHELRGRVGAGTSVLYQCHPHHQHTALYPVIAQLERALGTVDRAATVTVEALEAQLVGSPAERRDEVPLFAALLSVPAGDRYEAPPMSPPERKRRTLEALCGQVTRRAADRPLLVIVEDAQWLDPTSREMLDSLASRIAGLRVLIVIAERPGLDATGAARSARTIDLAGLSRTECETMVSVLTGGDRYPAAVLERILSRADGVPLFLEELAQTVVYTDAGASPGARGIVDGSAGTTIPMTLQDLLVARLDQLGPAKALAQVASVIGREFSADLLASSAGVAFESLAPALERLTASGLVLQRSDGFFFKHALVQDAAYQSLLRSRRRELHARIAGVLEVQSSRQGAGELELLAHHYAHAGLDAKAMEYWLRAGRHALERSANVEACEHFVHALAARAQLPGDAPDEAELLCLIGLGAARRAVEGFASRGVEESFGRARELAERGVGTTAQLMDALRGLFACYYARSDFRRAREQGERVLERAADSSSYLMMGNWMLGCVLFWQGEFAAARQRLETALSLYDPVRQRSQTLDSQIDLQANAMVHLGWTLWFLGHADQARTTADAAIALSRRLGQPFALAMALFWACATRACCGDRAAVESLTAELRAVTTKYHIAYLLTACSALEAHAAVAGDDVTGAVERVRRAIDEFQHQQAGLGWTFAMSLPAAACAQLGQVEDGLALVADAFEAAGRHGDCFWEAELHRLKGDLLLAGSAAASGEAEECYRKAAELAERQGARFLLLRAVTSLTRLHRQMGRHDTAYWLQSVCDSFVEGHDTDDVQNARRELALGSPGIAPAGA